MRQDIVNLLQKDFPNARPGYLEVVVQAIELHAKKNNDYNGSKPLFAERPTLQEMFYDIKRKYSRLHHLIMGGTDPQVDEKLEDTALDLGNYGFLLAEDIISKIKNPNGTKSVHMGEELDS